MLTALRDECLLSADSRKELDSDLDMCEWFSIQCDESVNASDTPQLAVFNWMVFGDFSTKESFITLFPLKTTTKGGDFCSAVKNYFVDLKKKVPIGKLVSVTADRTPAVTGENAYSWKFHVFVMFYSEFRIPVFCKCTA